MSNSKEIRRSEEKKWQEMLQLNSNQSNILNEEDFEKEVQGKKSEKKTIDSAGVTFFLLISAYLFILFLNQNTPIQYTNVQFDFRVFCPIYSEKQFISGWAQILNSIPGIPPKLPPKEDLSRTYVVVISSNSVDNTECEGDPSIDKKCHDDLIRYCGLTRKWNETCDSGKLEYVCSTPGPIFDLEIQEEIYVFWVNNITHLDAKAATFPTYEQMKLNACYNGSYSTRPERCIQKTKPSSWQDCQYYDPTNLGNAPTGEYNIDVDHWPTTTHVHGLEVRPTFDGSPLSWFSHEAKGVGFFSAEDTYFGKLSQAEAQTIRGLFASSGQQVKINIYPNTQLPGSLWYHDHAMASTGFNVNKGLTGMYLLRNSTHQSTHHQVLPTKKYEQNILISLGSYEVNQTKNGNVYSSRKEFESDVWWRLRILNADFNALYEDLRFVREDSEKEEIIIPFHIIGTDSSLRRNVLHNQTSVTLSSGERVDILIKFNPVELPQYSKVYFVQGDRTGDHYKLFQLMIGSRCTDPEGLNYTPPTIIDVPYTDLSTVNDSEIAKIRMRPLLRSWNMDGFGINGQFLYHRGDSEKPEIGTTEDWYFINGMYTFHINHPMHLHLVNFQEVRQYTLRKMQVDYNETVVDGGPEIYMSFYEMDFFLQPNVSCSWDGYAEIKEKYQKGTLEEEDYKVLGKWITYSSGVDLLLECFENFKSENVFDQNRVSSLDVRMTKPTTNYRPKDGCSLSNHLYLCEDKSSQIPEYKKGWKETSLVRFGYVLVIRVRWTATTYDPVLNGTNYFHIPEKELIQFPGYTYHCHFLQHEDLELMRPIMLQPSAASNISNWESSYKKYNSPCQQSNQSSFT